MHKIKSGNEHIPAKLARASHEAEIGWAHPRELVQDAAMQIPVPIEGQLRRGVQLKHHGPPHVLTLSH